MLIATAARVYSSTGSGGAASPALRFEEGMIRCLAEGRYTSAIGLASGEIVLFSDGESQRISTGIEAPLTCVTVMNEDPMSLLIGTEGPHIYRLTGEGGPAQRLATFDELECRDDWYTPWGGPAAVRSLAHSEDWVYADIHVGSIMRSSDGGESWAPVTPDLHEDVHQVATSPRREKRVYANTANAVYISEDRGGSWEHRAVGLSARYGRAIAVHPEDPDCLLASVSTGPGRNAEGKLYRSEDAGRAWTHAAEGFPATTRGNIDTFHIAFSSAGTAWAAAEGTLYRSEDRGKKWTPFWETSEPIAAISCAA